MSNSATCDDQRLLSILRDGLSSDEADQAAVHLESCDYCQERLQHLAASAEEWKHAAKVLSDPGSGPLAESVATRVGVTSWSESMASQLLSPPSHPEMLGRIGRYEIERLIGAGGMGVVFRGHDAELNRPVAVKLLAPYLASSATARKRFAREARAAAAVVHQHVVPIHNVETEREIPFLVMHYVAGQSLQARIDRTGALTVEEILRIGMQVAAGLAAAHQQGLVHRDIKPSNILLEDVTVERALITDFGLARAINDASLTHTGTHMGTPQFMSPEQSRGESVDQKSDLFSLGSVMYTMCTGRPPFQAETPYGIIRRIAEEEPQRIRHINPEIPVWLCSVVERLMSKEKQNRYSSASEVAVLLEGCLGHAQRPDAVPLPHAVQSKSRGNKLTKGLITLFGGVLLLIAAVVYFRHNDYGVVSIDVRHESLKVSVGEETVTFNNGSDEPIPIASGEQRLVVQRGDTKLATRGFLVPPNDKAVAFVVELGKDAVIVRKDGSEFDRLEFRNKMDSNPRATARTTIAKEDESAAGELRMKQVLTISTKDKIQFHHAKIHISEDQNMLLVDRWSGDNIAFQINPLISEVSPVSVGGWSGPRLLGGASRIITKKWDYAMITDPFNSVAPRLNPVPHEKVDGDWADPVGSPFEDILATRPKLRQLQFWDAKTLKPLTPPIDRAENVSGMSFTSDGKYFRAYGGDRMTIFNPRTGEPVAGPFYSGPYQYFLSSPESYAEYQPRTAYDPATQRIVCFENLGEADDLSCTVTIHSLVDDSEPVKLRLPVHGYQASWIDSNHLLLRAGRTLASNRYATYPLIVVFLGGEAPEFTELHPNVDDFGISPDGKRVVGTVHVGGAFRTFCWDPESRVPLWEQLGGFVSFGNTDWVVTHNYGDTVRICSTDDGSVLWSKEEVLIAKINRERIWLFFEQAFESWQPIAVQKQ